MSERRNGSASETIPTVCELPRSMSLVTVAGLISMQATFTQAGSKFLGYVRSIGTSGGGG